MGKEKKKLIKSWIFMLFVEKTIFLNLRKKTSLKGIENVKTLVFKIGLSESAESWTIDGESPVAERSVKMFSHSFIPSSMGHVKSRVNQRGPPRKAKYSWMTDSEQYREGKVKENP